MPPIRQTISTARSSGARCSSRSASCPSASAIVSLRYGAELNASEIAAAVGIEPATVRKILERTRTRLGARIEALSSPDGGMS